MNQLTKYMALSVLNIIIDVATLALPIPIIVGLQMPMRQKITICRIFGTGAFVCAVAIRRTTLLPSLMVSTDYTWDAVEQFEWCFAEVNASILCACAPALKPFFSRYIPGLLSSHFRSRDHHGSPKNTGPSFQSSPSHVSGQSKSNTYEMEVHDNVSIDTTTNQQNTADDEMRLWTRNASGGNSMTGTSTL